MKDKKFADNFAFNLLMPKDMVIILWEKHRDINILADKFKVTLLHMAMRLEQLNII